MRDANCYANGNSYIHSDGDCYGYGHIHSDCNGNGNVYAYSNGNSNSYANCNHRAATYTHAAAETDTGAAHEQLLFR